jgi:hypothetical protein
MNKSVEEIFSHLQSKLAHERLGHWQKGFVQDLFEQYKKTGSLSVRQTECLNDVYEKNSPEKIKEAVSFADSFRHDRKLQEVWKAAIEYYEQNLPYFHDVVLKAKSEKDFVPTRELFKKMTENNFFSSWYKLKNAPAFYEVGDLVKIAGQKPNQTFVEKAGNKLRQSNPDFNHYKSIYSGGRWYQAKKEEHLFLIEEVCDFIFTLSRGSKLYRAIDISGDSGTMFLEQRMIKKAN